MKRLFLAVAAGVLLTVVFFFIGAFYSGGGHNLTAITILFPYSGLVSLSLKYTPWEFISMSLLLIQFPIYALMFAYSGQRRNFVAIVIVLAHTVAAVIALRVYESSKARYGLLLPTVAIQQLIGPERREPGG
jgi:hypothetical protein